MTFHRTLQFRIVVAAAVLSALIVVAVSIYVVQDARDRAIGVLDTRVAEQAALIANSLPARLAGAPIASAASGASGARVTILDGAGEVIEDSHAGFGERPGLINRPEVDRALADGASLMHVPDPVLGGEAAVAVRVVMGDDGPDAIVRVALPISDADDAIDNVEKTAVLGGIIVVAVATLFATLLSARLTRSIATVTAGVRQVAYGDLGHRLRPEPPREVEQLATAVNEMAGRLSDLIALEEGERTRIQSILSTMTDGVVVVDSDGTVELANPSALAMLEAPAGFAPGDPLYALNRNYELNQIAVESAKARRPRQGEVEFLDSRRFIQVRTAPLPESEGRLTANRALVLLRDVTEMRRVEITRREFVSNASHELRTPLTAIRASVETLEGGAVDDEAAATEFFRRIGEDLARMDNLIREMLELSRLETGEARLNFVSLHPEDLVGNAKELMAPQARLAGVELRSSVGDGVPDFEGDERRIVELLTNLLANAIRASAEGSVVRLSAEADGDAVAFCVSDSGPGIEAEQLPHIFERFYKGDPSRSDGGAGLGLAIVKHIAEAHHGEVFVESEPGMGARFTARIPLSHTVEPGNHPSAATNI